MNEPIHINEASFERAVLQAPVPVVVDFWAPWCGPCRMLSPVLDEIARERAGAVLVAKVNVDDEPALAQRFGIRGIPALLHFSGGELKEQVAGVAAKQTILARLDALAAARTARRGADTEIQPAFTNVARP